MWRRLGWLWISNLGIASKEFAANQNCSTSDQGKTQDTTTTTTVAEEGQFVRCQREGQKAAAQGGERGGYPGQARAERTGTGMTIWPIGR